MSDSGSRGSSISGTGETRMLERRVSNNRADLSGDGQMNYFFSWFNTWSDLQKSDFVPVLAGKMNKNGNYHVNGGLADDFKSLDCSNGSRPPSLFACQVKLFHEWFAGWSDDQKSYLVLRLKDIDEVFYQKYEERVQNPDMEGPKDYFEPGISPELVKIPNRSEEEVNQENNKENVSISNGKNEDINETSPMKEKYERQGSSEEAALSPIAE